MRRGSHWRTSEGIAGCMTATPRPVAIVKANSTAALGAEPRSAPAMPATMSPMIAAAAAPSRAMISEPGTAASANRSDGRPVSTPTSVSLSARSAWISGMTGGTARMVRRSPMPTSHNRATGSSAWRKLAAAPSLAGDADIALRFGGFPLLGLGLRGVVVAGAVAVEDEAHQHHAHQDGEEDAEEHRDRDMALHLERREAIDRPHAQETEHGQPRADKRKL